MNWRKLWLDSEEKPRKRQVRKKAIRQIPNAITVLRILLVPLVIFLLVEAENSWELWLAVFFFVLSAATDGIDGAIARRKDLVSKTGQLLDPIADKALLGGSLIGLSYVGQVSWIPTLLILSREIVVTIYRLVVARRRVIASSKGGKLKTVIQSTAIPIVIAPIEFLGEWVLVLNQAVIWIAVIATIWSGYEFFRKQFVS
jgi:CDP-diacylglycerol--glycerol-3-phosphate 3-phosphatidyltransferase